MDRRDETGLASKMAKTGFVYFSCPWFRKGRAAHRWQRNWIAATALAHGLELLTNDRKKFSRVPGLRVETF